MSRRSRRPAFRATGAEAGRLDSSYGAIRVPAAVPVNTITVGVVAGEPDRN